jgi:hypothetical protein
MLVTLQGTDSCFGTLLLLLLLFILTANWFSLGGSGTTVRYYTQTTNLTQNNTTIKRNTLHKTTHTQ